MPNVYHINFTTEELVKHSIFHLTSIGVIVNKQVRNRIVEKRIHVRIEHLRISTYANFKKNVKEIEQRKKDNPKEKQLAKILPTVPAGEQKIKVKKNSVIKFYNPHFRREIFKN